MQEIKLAQVGEDLDYKAYEHRTNRAYSQLAHVMPKLVAEYEVQLKTLDERRRFYQNLDDFQKRTAIGLIANNLLDDEERIESYVKAQLEKELRPKPRPQGIVFYSEGTMTAMLEQLYKTPLQVSQEDALDFIGLNPSVFVSTQRNSIAEFRDGVDKVLSDSDIFIMLFGKRKERQELYGKLAENMKDLDVYSERFVEGTRISMQLALRFLYHFATGKYYYPFKEMASGKVLHGLHYETSLELRKILQNLSKYKPRKVEFNETIAEVMELVDKTGLNEKIVQLMLEKGQTTLGLKEAMQYSPELSNINEKDIGKMYIDNRGNIVKVVDIESEFPTSNPIKLTTSSLYRRFISRPVLNLYRLRLSPKGLIKRYEEFGDTYKKLADLLNGLEVATTPEMYNQLRSTTDLPEAAIRTSREAFSRASRYRAKLFNTFEQILVETHTLSKGKEVLELERKTKPSILTRVSQDYMDIQHLPLTKKALFWGGAVTLNILSATGGLYGTSSFSTPEELSRSLLEIFASPQWSLGTATGTLGFTEAGPRVIRFMRNNLSHAYSKLRGGVKEI